MSRRWVLVGAVAAVVVALLTAVIVVWQQRPLQADLEPSSPDSVDRAGATTTLLAELESALVDGDVDALARLAGDDRDAARELNSLAANVRVLRIADLGLRYVGESTAPLEASRDGEDAWVSDVQLTWRFRGVDRAASTLEVPVAASADGDAAVFETARVPGRGRVPLWFVEPVRVSRSARTMVVATSPGEARRLGRQAVVALRTVRGTFSRWTGPLVVEAPATAPQFVSAAGVAARAARTIAAVTASTDGSQLPSSPVHVYLNPQVFQPLGPRGQQIVVSHEAAHVALGAASSSVPLWLSEGIADYVALVGSPIPDATLAAQIRRLVRDRGEPAHLPGPLEFDGGNEDIGAWYEAAWLAVQLIAQRYGERELFAFYRAVERNGDTRRAFREVLGTDQQAFVDDWGDRLGRLAG